MGFTTGPARGKSCDIFEPGPSTSLSNLNSMIFCGNKNPDDQDNNTPAKKRSLPEIGNMSSPVAGGSEKSSSSKPTEVVIFVKPINVSLLTRVFCVTPNTGLLIMVPIIKLKRKPSQQSDIITGLSAMSLDTKGQLRQADPNGSGQINPKRKSIDDAPVLGEALAGLKKMKVGEAGVALI